MNKITQLIDSLCLYIHHVHPSLLIKCFQNLVLAKLCRNHPPEMHKGHIICDYFSEITNSSLIKHSPCNSQQVRKYILSANILFKQTSYISSPQKCLQLPTKEHIAIFFCVFVSKLWSKNSNEIAFFCLSCFFRVLNQQIQWNLKPPWPYHTICFNHIISTILLMDEIRLTTLDGAKTL